MQFTQDELNKILEDHQHWWRKDCEGWEDMRANLSGADLSGADLSGANLYGANLSGANLSGADLSGADLSGANLYGANLSGANLYGADLYGANLYGANLYGANLYGADLYGANLSGADLSGANLSGANLYGADLYGAEGVFIPYACPDFGMFIGFKKAKTDAIEYGTCIVVLEIPEDAKRLSATGRKCRCDKAKVLQIQTLNGDPIDGVARSSHDPKFIYKPGEMVSVEDFCEDRWQECSAGIHFFINREEAVRWVI